MTAEKTVPKWQRLICGLMAIGAFAGMFSQIQNGVSFELESSYLIFKLIAGMIGLYFFSHIAVRGSLPFRQKRIDHDT